MDTVIKNFTEKLTKTLPLDDAVFRSKLDDAGLFYGDLKEEVKAKPTAAQKAEHFLDHGIKSDADNILKLLKVMEEFNNSSVKNLAREIKVDVDKYYKEPGQGSPNQPSMKKRKIDGWEVCKDHLQSCYLNREPEPTRWSKFGGPDLHLDVAIIQSKDLDDKCRREHSMGVIKGNYITIDKILTTGHQKITLLEGDPGAGKTTITIEMCKRWAESEFLQNELMFLIPLRYPYLQKVSTSDELFDKLKCSEMKEYVHQYNGKGLVFILDGWDELPDDLQSHLFYYDIIFNNAFSCSTIIVTSRPSCSDQVAGKVRDRHYQILGFTPRMVETYINAYFINDFKSAECLLDILKVRSYLRQDFYIPVTVVIMCFVYRHNDNQLPGTLSKLYEKFVILCIRANVPENLKKKVQSLHKLPEELKSIFTKLCKIALEMLVDNKLFFDGDELEDELKLTSTDVFGLLSVEHVTNEYADKDTRCSFIHRSVQELLSSICLVQSNCVQDYIDKHLFSGSYLLNVFPFVFGLIPKEHLNPLAERLRQKFVTTGRQSSLLTTIVHCLFEAQDETLCHKFGEVFNEHKDVELAVDSDLEYRYAAYFLSVCGCKALNVNFNKHGGFSRLTDTVIEMMSKYLCNTSTEIISFWFADFNQSPRGLFLNKTILNNLGNLVSVLATLQVLYLGCLFKKGVNLGSSDHFYTALCSSKSLHSLQFNEFYITSDDCKRLKKVLQNSTCRLRFLTLSKLDNTDSLAIILDGLACNRTITMFSTWVDSSDGSDMFQESILNCLRSNKSLIAIDFTSIYEISGITICQRSDNNSLNVLWSSLQVCSICTGLQSNNTLVLLDICGCYIDKTASDAVCIMLKLNKTLKHLFLDPSHMEKQEAIAIIHSCNANSTLKILSLCHWPDPQREIKGLEDFIFSFAHDEEIKVAMNTLQLNQKMLKIIWNRSEYLYSSAKLSLYDQQKATIDSITCDTH